MNKIKYVIFIVLLVLTTTGVSAESFPTCIARCKADVMNIDECMQDEKIHWEANTSTNFKHACRDIIRNERFECRGLCEKNRAEQNRAAQYFDSDVRHFPLTNN